MAEFITKCPHCNAELQVQDEWIGMEVECPQCKKMFVIQENSLQMQNKQMVSPPKIQISIKELQDQVIVKAKQFFKSKKNCWYQHHSCCICRCVCAFHYIIFQI